MSRVVSARLDSKLYSAFTDWCDRMDVAPSIALRHLLRIALTDEGGDASGFSEGFAQGLREFKRRLYEISEEL